MEFSLTMTDLSRLKSQKTVTVGEIISLLYDICQDASEETGLPLDQLPLGTEEILYKRLPWASRFLVKTYAQTDIPQQMGIVLKKMEQMKGQLLEQESQAAALSRELEALHAKEQALDQQEQLMGDRLVQKQELLTRIRDSENRLDACRNADLPSLQKQLQQTEADLRELQRQIGEGQAREQQLLGEKDRADQENEALREKQQQLCAEIRDLKDSQSRIAVSLQNQQQEKEQLETENGNLLDQLEAVRNQLAQGKQENLPLLQSQLASSREELQNIQKSCEEASAELARNRILSDQTDEKAKKIREEILRLADAISACNLQIQEKMSTKDALNDQYNQRCGKLTALDEEAAELREKVNSITKELETCDTAALKQRLEQSYLEKQNLLAEHRKKQADLAVLETEIREDTARLSNLESQRKAKSFTLMDQKKTLEENSRLLDELKQQEEELQSQLKNYDSQEISRVKGRIQSLCNAMRQFREDQEKLNTRFPNLGEGPKELQKKTQILKELCIDYSEQYQSLIRAFEAGQIDSL